MTKSGKLFCATKNRSQAITVTEFVNFPNSLMTAMHGWTWFQASMKAPLTNIISSHEEVCQTPGDNIAMICKIWIIVQTAARQKFHWEFARLFRFLIAN